MKIEIKSDDGLIPLSVDGKEVLVDPWLLDEKITDTLLAEGIDTNEKILQAFNGILNGLGLPPVNYRNMGQIRIGLAAVVEEIKKKDGWAVTRSTTPNSSSSTAESTSSPSNPDSSGFSDSPSPPSEPEKDSERV